MTRNIIFKNVGEDLTFKILPDSKAEKVKLLTDPYLLPDSIIKRVIETFESELELGLEKNPNTQSSLQMANTFVPKLLSGNEKGAFLALDLGGTNFRVILLTFQQDGKVDCFVQYYTVPEPLRLGEGELLFDFLAECMHDFLGKKGLLGKKLPLGFCFSFPMIQTGIDEGILVTWTKSFNCKNVVGKEVVQMLKHSFSKKEGVNVDVVAIVNDATGTMMMGSYIDKRTAIGMILGTGCNAAYFEKVERIEKWEGKHPGIDEVIIDIEWGAFGDNGVLDFMKTEIDKDVDEASLLVNSFTFEKLFAGKYIGDIVRRVLLLLIEKNVLSKSDLETWTFTAADVSNTLEESNLEKILENLKSKGFLKATLEDADIVHYVCTAISARGALLVSICLSSLLRRMDKEYATIAIDGSLFKHHPRYETYMRKFIATLAPNQKFELILAEDGSGKGAGLVAAVVTSLDTSLLHS
ncbi:hexokinase type 2 [Trichonephila clavata]|uniref:Phosphotransferase n=1 Tax=Trichonephila clavata TaxID=2740835 RepID=A0A8X6HTX0_TRICU|nr:hexokinase type 2 [Trichonephila clavata]